MKVAVIGLGRMGEAIARALLKQGYSVAVYNRTFSKVQPLVEAGALGFKTIKEAVSSVEATISVLHNDQAVLEATKEIVEHIKENAIHMGISTVLPKTAEEVHKMHAAKKGRYVSSVIAGMPIAALEKKATTYFACEDSDKEIANQVLDCFSKKVVFLGDSVTSPNIMKICANYTLITSFELMGEVFTFAEKSGFDLDVVRSYFKEVFGHPSYQHYVDKIRERDFDNVNFDVRGGNKDVTVFQEAFRDLNVPSKLIDVLKEQYVRALEKGKEESDWSCLYNLLREDSGIKE